MKTSPLRSALALALLVIPLVGCVTPTASVTQLDLRRLSLQQLDVGLILDLNNPNDFSIPLEGIDWALGLFDASVADGTARPEATIPAQGSSAVDVPISLRVADLPSTARQVVSASEIPWNVGGTCHFNLPASTIAVDFSRSGHWNNPLR